jgi:NADPH:quinone reductase
MDRFGGIETLALQTLPKHKVGAREVLIRVEAAGVGSWGRCLALGRYHRTFGLESKFLVCLAEL